MVCLIYFALENMLSAPTAAGGTGLVVNTAATELQQSCNRELLNAVRGPTAAGATGLVVVNIA